MIHTNVNDVNRQCRRYKNGFPMNVFGITSVVTMQHRRCCTFDSPGLASESEGYPGSFAVSGNNTVGVVPFIYWHVIAAFHIENVQHLRC